MRYLAALACVAVFVFSVFLALMSGAWLIPIGGLCWLPLAWILAFDGRWAHP